MGRVSSADQLNNLRVFLASPGGVEDERRAVYRLVDELNVSIRRHGWQVEVLGWEDRAPARGRAQDNINPDVARQGASSVCPAMKGGSARRTSGIAWRVRGRTWIGKNRTRVDVSLCSTSSAGVRPWVAALTTLIRPRTPLPQDGGSAGGFKGLLAVWW